MVGTQWTFVKSYADFQTWRIQATKDLRKWSSAFILQMHHLRPRGLSWSAHDHTKGSGGFGFSTESLSLGHHSALCCCHGLVPWPYRTVDAFIECTEVVCVSHLERSASIGGSIVMVAQSTEKSQGVWPKPDSSLLPLEPKGYWQLARTKLFVSPASLWWAFSVWCAFSPERGSLRGLSGHLGLAWHFPKEPTQEPRGTFVRSPHTGEKAERLLTKDTGRIPSLAELQINCPSRMRVRLGIKLCGGHATCIVSV